MYFDKYPTGKGDIILNLSDSVYYLITTHKITYDCFIAAINLPGISRKKKEKKKTISMSSFVLQK